MNYFYLYHNRLNHLGLPITKCLVSPIYTTHILFQNKSSIKAKLKIHFNKCNSQILVIWNFSTNQDTVPWIGEKLPIRAEFQQFSRDNMHIRVPGKLLEIYSKVLVFSNLGPLVGDNIWFLGKLRDGLVPLFLHILGHRLLDWRTLGPWNAFLTVFQAPWHTCDSWKTLGTPLQCF